MIRFTKKQAHLYSELLSEKEVEILDGRTRRTAFIIQRLLGDENVKIESNEVGQEFILITEQYKKSIR